MHHALEIQEILVDVFSHCEKCDLSSLARTGRMFKEPALDALWATLTDITPLVRCVPEAASDQSSLVYSFRRPLTQTEWDVLRGYTRRIRFIKWSGGELDRKSLDILSNQPTTEPLFPSLRSLDCTYVVALHLLRHPHPSLLSVDFIVAWEYTYRRIETSRLYGFLLAFPQFCPNIRRAHFNDLDRPQENDCTIRREDAISDCIRGLQSLEDVRCLRVPLDAAAIVHLSRMDGLTRLSLTPDAPLLHSDPPLVFPSLRDVLLESESWSSISRFFSRVRLPTIAQLSVIVSELPSQLELSSLFASIQMCAANSTIHELHVYGELSSRVHSLPLLGLDDLRPCMAFSNLHSVNFDIQWNVGLIDNDLLTLTSAWPRLEVLFICQSEGWNTTGGITPNGLLQLLQTCPSLHQMALVMNTQGHIEFTRSPECLGPTLPRSFSLDVLDSIIDDDAVSPVAAFFAFVSLPGFRLSGGKHTGQEASTSRWNEVRRRVNDAIIRRAS